MSSRFLGMLFFVIIFATLASSQMQDPAVAPQAPPNTVPQGTTFLIRLNDKLDTSRLRPGDRFTARLAEDISTANNMVLEHDSKIKGHVSAVDPGLHSRLLLSFDEVKSEHGWIPVEATVVGVPGEHGMKPVGEEGELERKGMSKQRMAEAIAVGAGSGAAAGSVLGKGRGAATGAGAGAVAGALLLFTVDRNLVLQKHTVLEVRLDHNLQLRSR